MIVKTNRPIGKVVGQYNGENILFSGENSTFAS